MSQTDENGVPSWLLGRWRLQRAEPGVELLPDTRMEFRAGGELIYILTVEGQEAAFSLSFAVRGNMLHTEHEGGHSMMARFDLEASGLLEFDFAGRRAWFRRERLM